MYALCLPKDQVDDKGEAKRGFFVDQFSKRAGSKGCTKAPIPASYLGGTPANHYMPDYNHAVVDDVAYKAVRVHTDTERKLFVRSGESSRHHHTHTDRRIRSRNPCSGGKDNASPVMLKRNNAGLWKVFEYSSLYTGVKTDEDLGDF
jgi:hypothetical protein